MPPAASTSDRKQSILPLFPLLASHDHSTRLDASCSLLSTLPLPAPPANDPDTAYALKRLIAGLASSNESARQGFAVALSQLVALLPDDRAASVLPQLIDATTSKSGLDAREERDLLFARLMGLHALVRSGVLVRPTGPASNAGESWKEVVLALVQLGNTKSWIKEPGYWVVCEALRVLLEVDDEVAWKDETVKWAVQRLLNDAREKAKGWSPEKVAVVLVLQTHGVDADYSAILAPTFPSGSLLSRSSLPSLAAALRGALSSQPSPFPESSSGPRQGSNAVKTSRGAGTPAPGQGPHFAWSLLLEAYFPTEGQTEGKLQDKAKWSDFWRICVDESLFASPSLPLKALGFSLLQSTLPRIPSSDAAALFGPHVLRVFANHLRKSTSSLTEEKTLSRVADKLAASVLPAYLSANPAAALPMLKVLTGEPNSHPAAFEHKFLERIVSRLPLVGVKGWVSYLQKLFLEPSVAAVAPAVGDDAEEEEDAAAAAREAEKRLTAQRTWALDQLLHVARNGGVVKDEEVVRGLVEFLAVVGWFEVKKESDKGARSYIPAPALTAAQRAAARSRFFSVVTSLLSASAPSTSATAPGPVFLGGAIWLSRAFATLENLSKDAKHFAPAEPASEDGDEDEADEEIAELKKRVKEMYALLEKGKKGEKVQKQEEERRKTARTLCEGVLLVEWDEKEEAAEVLEQLADTLPMLFPTLLAAYKSVDEDEAMSDSEGDAPEPTTVLISLLLSLLLRPSAFVKAVAAEVVEGFAGEMGEQAVGLLLETIAPAPEEADLETEEAEGADVEMKGSEGKKAKKGKKAEEESDASGDEDEDDVEESDVEVDEKFREELLAALQAGGLAVDEDAEDDDDDDDEEELLDDEAMMELDDKLADIFRANGGGRQSKKRDRTDDLHYRLRLIDLLDVLAHKGPSSSLLLAAFVPLFNLARSSAVLEAELRTKATKLLRFLVQPRKAASDADVLASPDTALEALEELHAIAQAVDSADYAPLCAQTAVALVKAALASPAATPATASAIATAFADSFEHYLATKNAKTKVQPLLTTEFCKRAPAAAWSMFERVVRLAKGESGEGAKKAGVNAYRRMQAFEVAQALLTSYANLKTAESKSAILASLPVYSSALHHAVSTSLTSAPSAATFDAARLKQLVKHALAAARLTVQLSSQARAAAPQAWAVAQWIELVDAAKRNERFKGAVAVQTLLAQLVRVLGGTVGDAEDAGAAKGKAAAARKDKKRKAPAGVEEAGAAAAAEPRGKKAKAHEDVADQSVPGEAEVEVEVEVEADEEEAAQGEENGAEADTPRKGKKDKKKDKKRRRSEGGQA
ncbi:SPOSA6832_01297 [Sporobolomyces salmonicolor]|uniref:SPOSA6832_01297-mRNA-1:cds n=1 Tax=Sporidiobolus salmonicolor TaxID=5005 RepID=A0A0D6EIL6_SPOSA|nr:SPOSA6832_01297 [Sporobolomyces salmonicolor]